MNVRPRLPLAFAFLTLLSFAAEARTPDLTLVPARPDRDGTNAGPLAPVVTMKELFVDTRPIQALLPQACAEVEPNEQSSQATSLSIPGSCTGTASSSDAFAITVRYSSGTTDGIEDVFSVTLAQSARLTLNLTFANPSADMDLFLFSMSGSTVTPIENSSSDGSAPETITTEDALAPGTYYVGVSAFTGSSSYTVTSSLVGGGGSGGGGSATCTPDSTSLCLSASRFRVQAQWQTESGQSGNGTAVPLTSDTGYFWFFDAANVEVVLKVLSVGCSVNNRFWVFAGGLTDVRVVLTVTDTQTGTVRTYTNPLKTAFAPIQDTEAFSTCQSTSCTYAASPTSQSFASAGGTGSVAVTAASGCAWTAQSNDSWITVTSGASGSGNGSVSYTVAANSGSSSRTGTLTAAGQTVTITQAGATGGGGSYAGSWSGTTTQGRPISFTIVGSAMTSLTIGWSVVGSTCNASGTTTYTFTTPRPLSGSSFSFSSTGTPLSATINMTFTSSTTATGSASFSYTQTVPVSCFGTAATSFTASRP